MKAKMIVFMLCENFHNWKGVGQAAKMQFYWGIYYRFSQITIAFCRDRHHSVSARHYVTVTWHLSHSCVCNIHHHNEQSHLSENSNRGEWLCIIERQWVTTPGGCVTCKWVESITSVSCQLQSILTMVDRVTIHIHCSEHSSNLAPPEWIQL